MIKFFVIGILFLMSSMTLAQPIVSLSDVTTPVNSSVTMPLNVQNFNSVATFLFRIEYDTTKISFTPSTGVINRRPELSAGGTFFSVTTNNVIGTTFRRAVIYWEYDLTNTINITSGKLFDIVFQYLSSPSASLVFASGSIVEGVSGNLNANFINGSISASTLVPVINLSPTTLPNFGNVIVGQNSTPQSYTVSGSNLTANILISAPSGFQVSTNSTTGFGSSLTLTQTAGSVSTTTIFSRFAPNAVQSFSGNITHTSTGATTQNVAVTGTGIAPLPAMTVSVTTLSFGNQTSGTSSAAQSFVVSGSNLTNNIVLTAPTGFEISLTSGTGFASTLNLTPTSGTVSNTTIFARFSPNAVQVFSGNISVATVGATTQNVALTGTGINLTAPSLLNPTNNSSLQTGNIFFNWSRAFGATNYRLQVSQDSLFATTIFNDSTIVDTFRTVNVTQSFRRIFWRVSSRNALTTSPFSLTFAFNTSDTIGFGNLQWPLNPVILRQDSVTVYGQIFVNGLTNAPGRGAGINAWLGWSNTNSNPNTWTNWIPATYNVDVGNNDEYQANIGAGLPRGVYYYAFRYQLNLGTFRYGGTNSFWNGTTSVNGILRINARPINRPTNLTVTNIQQRRASFSWIDNSNNEDNFVLQRKLGDSLSTNTYSDVATLNSNQITFTDTTLTPLTQYSYRVFARSIDTVSTFSNQISFTTQPSSVGAENILSDFMVMQNFPNPFNPSTNVQYNLPYSSNVKLVVYNSLGNIVFERSFESQNAGLHSLQFNATDLASGVYYYSIIAISLDGNKQHRATKKMLYLK
ncbi:MAG: hypothetical protein C0425_09625 [Chlorobiaceae bacterium]|nr:hypothetical protein [Chlorobiaceae bacterium]MBA4310580.1 hypothetical protein [Chlorobiaceae bacterium]